MHRDILAACLLMTLPRSTEAQADDGVWLVAGALAVPPGAGLRIDKGWWVRDKIAAGVHGLALLDLAREAARGQLGPVVTFQPEPTTFVSVSGGVVYNFGATLHSSDGTLTWGASLAARIGIGERERTAIGIELNWVPQIKVYRDLTGEAGGPSVLLQIGRQGF